MIRIRINFLCLIMQIIINYFFQNLQSLQKLNRPKRNILILDPMENNFETDKLYEGMIMLSRSYALYN